MSPSFAACQVLWVVVELVRLFLEQVVVDKVEAGPLVEELHHPVKHTCCLAPTSLLDILLRHFAHTSQRVTVQLVNYKQCQYIQNITSIGQIS